MKTYISRLMLIASLLALLFVPPTYGGHSEERQHAAPAANASGKPADLLDLPIAAQGQISATLGRDQSSYHASRHGKSVRLGNPKHRIKAEFTAEDVRIGMGAAQWSLAFRGYAYGDKLQPAATTKPHAALNRVEYRRGELTEWYLNGPLGLEQGFTLSRAPGKSNGEPLTLAFKLSGNLTASADATGKALILSRSDGTQILRYRGLTAHDATGRELHAWLQVKGEQLWLRVDDAGAQYPVVVDPFIQQAKLTAFDGAADDRFGTWVAISGDTIVVGAPFDDTAAACPCNQGSAYVFVKPAGGWSDPITQQAKLLASDRAGGDQFGFSVAVDGDTVVVGSPIDDVFISPTNRVDQGSAYVFVKPLAGWSGTLTQTAKLTALDGAPNDFFGLRVAVSGDTIVVGVRLDDIGANSDQGSAYVFVKPEAGWRNATHDAKLIASDGALSDQFGNAVAVSGNTVVVAAPLDNIGANVDQGSAYVFVKPQVGWSGERTEDAKLIASDFDTAPQFPSEAFGSSVAASGDTIVMGAHFADRNSLFRRTGAAYVFQKPAAGWSGTLTEIAKLVASDGEFPDQMGTTVAISGDTIAVGSGGDDIGTNANQGSVYAFTKPIGGWSGTLTEDIKLTASDGAASDSFGNSVAVSGETIVAGSPLGDIGANLNQGSVYVFVNEGPFTLTPAIAENPVGTDHTVTATVRDANGQPVPDATVHFNVTGSVTQAGSCTTNANGRCEFTYHGPSEPGEDSIAGFADLNGNGIHDAGEPDGTATKKWVEDEPPILSLPPNRTLEATSAAGATLTFIATAADEVDGSVPIECSPSSGSTFPLGTTTVNCSATDSAGNTTTGSFDVTVVDTSAPSLSLPGDITEEATSAAGAVVNFQATGHDLVDGEISAVCSPESGTQFPLGTTSVDCSVTDAAGNGDFGSFTVTVIDTTAPELSVPGDITQEATSAAGASVNFEATANDVVDGAIAAACTPVSGNQFPLGATSVDCTVTDAAGNTTSGSFNVTVVDTTPPELTLPPNLTHEATSAAGTVVTYENATANDVVDGAVAAVCSPASGAQFPLGINSVSCTATDAHNNSSSGTFTIAVVDTTPPVLTLPANIAATATSSAGALVTYSASANDLVDGALTPSCMPVSGSTFAVGTTTVTCVATDKAGNSVVGSFTVTVESGTVSFASFHTLAQIDLRPGANDDVFAVEGVFTLGAGSNGINPRSEPVTLVVGNASWTITSGFQRGHFGGFLFNGMVGATRLAVAIYPLQGGRFILIAAGSGAELTGVSNPLSVSLVIGNDGGSDSVFAKIK